MHMRTIAILLTSSFILSSLALIVVLQAHETPLQTQLAREESRQIVDLLRPNLAQTQERWSFQDK